MARSLGAAWLAAMQQDSPQIRYYFEVETSASTSIACTSGLYDSGTYYPAALGNVDGVAAKLDPLTRKAAMGGLSVTVQDDWIRATAVATRLKGKKATLKIGTKDLALGSWENLFVGVIEDVEPIAGGKWVNVKCLDAYSILSTNPVMGEYIGHPLDIIEQLIADADVSTDFYTASEFDPTAAAYSSIGHFSVSNLNVVKKGTREVEIDTRNDYFGVLTRQQETTEPVESWPLVNELAQLCGGSIIPDEDGKLGFSVFDATASAAVHWTKDDYTDLQQKSDRVVNFVSIDTIAPTGEDFWASFAVRDSTSTAAYAYPGTSERLFQHKIQTNWQQLNVGILTSIVSAAATSFTVQNLAAMSGFVASAGGSQPSWAQVSASKPAYYRIGTEIIKVTAITPDTSSPIMTTEVQSRQYAFSGTVTCTRGAFGTTAYEHDPSNIDEAIVLDVTMPCIRAEQILDRFEDGAPVVELTTNWQHFAYEIGDLVTFDCDWFLHFGADGMDNSTKWEITGKEPKPEGIQWTLCRATIGSNSHTATFADWFKMGHSASAVAGILLPDINDGTPRVGVPYVIDGLTVSATSGFGADLSTGTASATAGMTTKVHAAVSFTFPASKDSYVYLSCLTGRPGFVAVANGATQPSTPVASVLLSKVVTNGSAVTSVDNSPDGRKTLPHHGEAIETGTVRLGGALSVQTNFGSRLANGDFGSTSRG